MSGFTVLPSEPDRPVSEYPALQLPLARFLGPTKHCQEYIWILHYVLLLYHPQFGKSAGLRPVIGVTVSLADRHLRDYYASSVAWSDFQALLP